MNTIEEDPVSPTSQPMRQTRSRGRKRRGTVTAPPPPPSASAAAAAAAAAATPASAEAGSDGRRQSIIPSMTTSKRLSTTLRMHDESGSHHSDKVGKLLKRYSHRLSDNGLGNAKLKKGAGKHDKYANGFLSPDNIPHPSERPQAISQPRRDADRGISVDHPSSSSSPSKKYIPNTKPVDDRATASAASTQPAAEKPVLIGLDEKNYPVPIRDFQDSSFDARQYVRSHLADSADYQVRDYLEKLRITREQIGKDMQKNLFNNYSQFVKISSEIMTLEQEIRYTRNMMNELCGLVVGMRLDKDAEKANASKDSKTEDSSVAMPILHQATRGDLVSNTPPPIPETPETRHHLIRSISSASLKNPPIIGHKATGNGNKEEQKIPEEQLLELDVMIAHRLMDDAVSTIERLKGDLEYEDIDPELIDRGDEVYDILAHDLASEFTSRKKIGKTIQLLIRLGYVDEARTQLLDSRSEIIRRRVDQVRKDSEDIAFYVSQVATISFTIIKSTIDIYRECFPAYNLASRIADWAYQEVHKYIDFFSETMKGVQPGSELYTRATAATRSQSDKLKDIGMSMNFLLNDVLNPHVPVTPQPSVQYADNTVYRNGSTPSTPGGHQLTIDVR
ncbi:Cullin repeat-like-containing domain protein [Myxozyma melibiosi]|uniref:Cullin repeat-like-containing domain protein n=1 Tax=Myxozyma melibiosi TaxID=54550 RepID=A0ABR1FCI9_9ASCO